MGLGVALVTRANLGTSPISSVPYVLSMILPVTIGEFTFLLSLVFLALQVVLLGRRFPREQWLQVFVGPVFGLFIDLGMRLFAFVNPGFYAARIVALLLGCVLLALGVHLQVLANVIINPGEGLVKTLALKTGWEFGTIKVLFDCTLVLLAVGVSVCAFARVRGLREGTIISAILVGVITRAFSVLFGGRQVNGPAIRL